MIKKPLVSVCMITYGHEHFIEQAINGVLMQDCNFDIELVIANDNSQDKSDEVINKIIKNHPKSSCIKYTKHDVNKGMMPNFVWALQQCNSKYIAICEGDDYWTDVLKLQKQYDFLEENNDFVLMFHPVKVLLSDGKLVDDFITVVPTDYQEQYALIKYGNFIHTPSVFFRNCITSYPKQFLESPIGDYFLYTLLLSFGKFKYINQPMAVYRYGVGYFSQYEGKIKFKKWIKTLLLIVASTKDEILKERLFRKIETDLRLDEFETSKIKIFKFLKIKNFILLFIPPIVFTIKNKIAIYYLGLKINYKK